MNFVSRDESGLRPPNSISGGINSEGTTGHWAGGSVWGGVIGDHSRCASIWRAFQAYHMDHHGWSDLAYNAGACPHGYVFEGRGPGRRSAANGTNTGNSRSAVVCYIGGEGDPFTLEGMQAMLDAAAYLEGDLIWDHGDWYNTACAGYEIRPWVQAGCPMSGVPVPPEPEPDPIPQPPQTGDEINVIVHELSEGSEGPEVGALQSILNGKAGQGLVVDNDFGEKTGDAVENWQRYFNMKTDRIVGTKTWQSLVSF